jgi:hypothetical protein
MPLGSLLAMAENTSGDSSFHPIAEREFQLRGPAERTVCVRIGIPEPDPKGCGNFRCPFQVTGLSNDAVQYAHGVDSFQALNLAFSGIRNLVRTNAEVLASFHPDFSLTWNEEPWEVVLPLWAWVTDSDQLHRLQRFLDVEIWAKKPTGDE